MNLFKDQETDYRRDGWIQNYNKVLDQTIYVIFLASVVSFLFTLVLVFAPFWVVVSWYANWR